MNSYKTQDGKLFVRITKPTSDEISRYYKTSGEFKTTGNSEDNPRVCKKATIEHTFCDEQYPVGSEWIMGESPGMKINFFGEKIVMIQDRDIHARIN